MKLPVEKILPIVLCIVFPALNAITTKGIIDINEVTDMMLARWAMVSVMLYCLWHLLSFVSEKSKTYKWLRILIAAIVFLIIVYNIFLLTPVFRKNDIKWIFIVRYFIAIVPFLVIQYALRAHKKVAQLELEKQQMLTENYKVQLASLRAKADPHFLFNSLNTLRTMVRHHDPKSEQFVLSLSDFYRQTLKYNELTFIKLDAEIKVMESYLFLMKSRYEDAVQIVLDIPESLAEKQIPTLALQTLVENCFKHNVMTSKRPLKIQVNGLDVDRIEVRNNIQEKLNPGLATGYGLESLKKRYELMGIKDGVEVLKSEGHFIARLKLV